MFSVKLVSRQNLCSTSRSLITLCKETGSCHALSVNQNQSGCCAPAAAAQFSRISPVCWLWRTDSQLVNRNALRGLSFFLCLLCQLCLMCALLKWAAHTLCRAQFSVSLDTVTKASHLAAVSPPSRRSVKGTCLCWLYTFPKIVRVLQFCVSLVRARECSCSQPPSWDDEQTTSTLLLCDYRGFESAKHSSHAISSVPVSLQRRLHSHSQRTLCFE